MQTINKILLPSFTKKLTKYLLFFLVAYSVSVIAFTLIATFLSLANVSAFGSFSVAFLFSSVSLFTILYGLNQYDLKKTGSKQIDYKRLKAPPLTRSSEWIPQLAQSIVLQLSQRSEFINFVARIVDQQLRPNLQQPQLIPTKKSLSVIFMRLLGFRHVPDNMVQVIQRHGLYHRAVSGPFVRSRLFSESFGPQIRVGVRVIERLYENIISRDGVAHNIRVSVKVFFDLRQAAPYLAKIIVQDGEGLVNGRVASLIDLTLRREVARLASTELLTPEFPVELEKAIEKRLSILENMGVSPLPIEDGIVVKEILAPKLIQQNRAEMLNIEEIIDSFTRKSSSQIKQALVARLLENIPNQLTLQLGGTGLPEISDGEEEETYTQLVLKAILEALENISETADEVSFRVQRRPSGRIYDN